MKNITITPLATIALMALLAFIFTGMPATIACAEENTPSKKIETEETAKAKVKIEPTATKAEIETKMEAKAEVETETTAPSTTPLQEKQKDMVEFVTKDKIYHCEENKRRIFNSISEPQQCNYDGDCHYFDYKYPWQPSACHKAVLSKSEKDKSMKDLVDIGEYTYQCIKNNPEEKIKFDKLNKEIIETKCELLRLYCYKGYCRSKNYSVHINYDNPVRQLR